MRNSEENHNPMADKGMIKRRLKNHPIGIDGNFIVADRLEINGTLKLFEYTGTVYTYFEPEEMDNAVIVASAEVHINHENKEIRLRTVTCNYGYDFTGAMIRQILNFADFYGYSVDLFNLNKNTIYKCYPK